MQSEHSTDIRTEFLEEIVRTQVEHSQTKVPDQKVIIKKLYNVFNASFPENHPDWHDIFHLLHSEFQDVVRLIAVGEYISAYLSIFHHVEYVCNTYSEDDDGKADYSTRIGNPKSIIQLGRVFLKNGLIDHQDYKNITDLNLIQKGIIRKEAEMEFIAIATTYKGGNSDVINDVFNHVMNHLVNAINIFHKLSKASEAVAEAGTGEIHYH